MLLGAVTVNSWSQFTPRLPRSWRRRSRSCAWPKWTPRRRKSWPKSLTSEASPLWNSSSMETAKSLSNTPVNTHTYTQTQAALYASSVNIITWLCIVCIFPPPSTFEGYHLLVCTLNQMCVFNLLYNLVGVRSFLIIIIFLSLCVSKLWFPQRPVGWVPRYWVEQLTHMQ